MAEIVFGNFVNAWFMVSLLLLLAFHYLSHRKKSAMAVMFGNFTVLKSVKAGFPFTLLVILRMLTVFLVVIISMEPVLKYDALSSDNHYMLAIDSSYSMMAKDFQPDRLEAAKEIAGRFVDGVSEKSDVGVVGFGAVDYLVSAPDSDKASVKYRISQMGQSDYGGTNIAGALFTSANQFTSARDGNRRVLILLTDGVNNIGQSPESALQYLKAMDVTVFTIGIGSGSAGFAQNSTDFNLGYDQKFLQFLAQETGGSFYPASGRGELESAFGSIRSSVVRTEEVHLSTYLVLALIIFLFFQWGPLLLHYGV